MDTVLEPTGGKQMKSPPSHRILPPASPASWQKELWQIAKETLWSQHGPTMIAGGLLIGTATTAIAIRSDTLLSAAGPLVSGAITGAGLLYLLTASALRRAAYGLSQRREETLRTEIDRLTVAKVAAAERLARIEQEQAGMAEQVFEHEFHTILGPALRALAPIITRLYKGHSRQLGEERDWEPDTDTASFPSERARDRRLLLFARALYCPSPSGDHSAASLWARSQLAKNTVSCDHIGVLHESRRVIVDFVERWCVATEGLKVPRQLMKSRLSVPSTARTFKMVWYLDLVFEVDVLNNRGPADPSTPASTLAAEICESACRSTSEFIYPISRGRMLVPFA
jgi:hypothetical protein